MMMRTSLENTNYSFLSFIMEHHIFEAQAFLKASCEDLSLWRLFFHKLCVRAGPGTAPRLPLAPAGLDLAAASIPPVCSTPPHPGSHHCKEAHGRLRCFGPRRPSGRGAASTASGEEEEARSLQESIILQYILASGLPGAPKGCCVLTGSVNGHLAHVSQPCANAQITKTLRMRKRFLRRGLTLCPGRTRRVVVKWRVEYQAHQAAPRCCPQGPGYRGEGVWWDSLLRGVSEVCWRWWRECSGICFSWCFYLCLWPRKAVEDGPSDWALVPA
ncbi:uncharacterized protein [Oryctolagus cuniculus]|uniref:uncharacterized protein isoform X2 n=1 Tax=Oryctolagus cuniculus TaxID=9986 RepID=UPI00387A527B